MLKHIGEYTQKFNKLLEVHKSLDGIIIHGDGKFCDIYMDCFFNVQLFEVVPNVSDNESFQEDLKDTMNKTIKKVQETIQKKTSEIYTGN